MNSGIYWGTGGRSINEDSVVLEDVRTNRGTCVMLAVCDGIGTLDHGEIVSGYVAESLVRWFYLSGVEMFGASRIRIRRSLNRCVYDAHTELRMRARDEGIRWGTTCTAVIVWNRSYAYLHLGDSSIHITGGKGGITTVTKKHRNASGELIRCVGSMRYFEPDIGFGTVRRGRGILVASDGFTECFDDGELGSMLDIRQDVNDERIDKRLNDIGTEIGIRGGLDNRSAVYVLF